MGACPTWGLQGVMLQAGETFKAGPVPVPVAPWPWHIGLVKSGGVRTWGGDGVLQAWLGTILKPGCDALALGTGRKSCP